MIACPFCGNAVANPTQEIIATVCGFSPMERRLFSAVWRGRGHAVPVERIFDVMWADHPSGGPDHDSKYRSLQYHVFKVRRKLFSTMYRIEFVGHCAGYCLTVRNQSQSQRAAA